MMASSSAGATDARVTAQPALDAALVAAVNGIRVSHNLAPLTSSPALTAAAAGHDLEMATDAYFDHDSAEGSPFWKRLTSYCSAGGPTCSVGENLLWATPTLTADHAIALWMASPEHRANILNPIWRQIGIAATQTTAVGGVFGAGPVTILTADFGTT